MKTPCIAGLLLFIASAGLHAETIAWTRLSNQAEDRYQDVPYHWLGDQSLRLTLEKLPDDGYAVDLLWGSKNDQRGALIVVNGHEQVLQAGGYAGFQWQRIQLPRKVDGKQYILDLLAAPPKAAFLAAIRVVSTDTALDDPLPESPSRGIQVSEPPPHPLQQWAGALQNERLSVWQRAAVHGDQALEALRRCRRYVDGWLAHADPKTGLIPRNLRGSHYWNGRDSAADNYSFMVLTSALTDRDLYHGRMTDMLRTETKLTSRIGALPADFDFGKQGFRFEQPDLNRLIFDGSEYVKDGLMPITEWLGPTPWSERMIAIVDSIMQHATAETPGGKIPSEDVEVNGEMMQVLSRLCFMSGDEKYLDMACRVADYYLLGDRHPTRDATRLGLRDHNCELISGLTEVYAACHFLRKDKAMAYHQPVHEMLDRILDVGINQHGLMYDMVNPQSGEVLRDAISDNWGYNYNGFYTVYLLDDVERYRRATRHALSNLEPHYLKFAWQGWGSDGIADSVEGAINLYNRESNVDGVAQWIDANVARMLLIQKPDGIIEGWHGDGNYARTAIMWVLMKQQGVTIQPWRDDVKLGAVRDGGTVRLLLAADLPWQGRLVFDQPRHRTMMRMPLDYPRINQFPEWFTVQAEDRLTVTIGDQRQERMGQELIDGLSVELNQEQTLRMTVAKVN